jgi:hypothetical protein
MSAVTVASRLSILRLLAVLASVLGSAVLIAVPTSAANPVPYNDFAAHGSVGLCDKAGNAVTSGKLSDKPFAWFAVSSLAAPAGYAGTGRKATLYVYQPRPNTYPNQWSGDQMTSSSPYTNPRYPMAAATAEDFSLQDFVTAFPPRWNGLLQLRIYYGMPNMPTWTETYAATDIKVTGSTWKVVRGASVPCTKGSATPNEPFHLSPSPSKASAAPATPAVSTNASASAAPSSSATASLAPSSASSSDVSASGSPVAAATASSDSGSGSRAPLWLVGLVGLAAVLVGGAWWFSRRFVSRGGM